MAATQGATSKSAAAAAAQAAFEDNLDLVVSLGWAFVDRHCAEKFAAAGAGAPAGLQPALGALQVRCRGCVGACWIWEGAGSGRGA
jgi:hypothetical protein